MSGFFFKIGYSALLLAVGLSLLVLIAQWLTNFEFTDMGWRMMWFWLGGGGVAALVIGGVCAIWEE